MSLTIHPKTKTILPHSGLEKTKSQSDEILEKVAQYMQEHFEIIKAPKFQDMSIADILKEKPVILFGELHSEEKIRKHFGWVINQLFHEKATLLVEHQVPKVEHMCGQVEFVDPAIVKRILCWGTYTDEQSPLMDLVAEHLYLQINAVKKAIGMMQSGAPTLADVNFDARLNNHIRNFPYEKEYRELKAFFNSHTNKNENFDSFWLLMIKLINKKNSEYLQSFVRIEQLQDDRSLYLNLNKELRLNFQPFVIAGKDHLKTDCMTLQSLISKNIPFIRCNPKPISSDDSKQSILKELRKENAEPIIDILEKTIIEMDKTSFSGIGSTSIYKVDYILFKYCELKLTEHKKPTI